ncbi:hypothetical protein [Haloarchaeobius litoreus]|uniref:Sec-independent protein translocase protein TatA n=1 Tax=Haloarchaeobius litoreus TaxID=755306 RepID=A0ABD6DL98_9EURY|nr:hypothetical protein [Haloarchaeobius litoreus]
MIPELNPVVLVAFIAGLLVDFDYAMTRLRGFGRLVFSKIPVESEQAVDDEREEAADE